MNTVCHVTSAHGRHDTRIFLKECRSIRRYGHDVSLVVADGGADEVVDGVKIWAVPKASGRLGRMLISSFRSYKKASSLGCELYHFHDPEMLPYALLLAIKGKVVVFDAHEDFPQQIKSKFYLGKYARVALSLFFSWFEALVCKRLSAVVTATPSINDKFIKIHPNSININNYPMLGELSSGEFEWVNKENSVAYVGGIAETRGIKEVVSALGYLSADIKLNLVGRFNKHDTLSYCKELPGWDRVNELGFKGREEVRGVLGSSIAGIVTFLPLPNHINSQPNKMFEYMSAGIPVIASNFDLWKEVVEGNGCGICVDPEDPKAISDAIMVLYNQPEKAKKMGLNGYLAVRDKYNWSNEEKKLIQLYRDIMERSDEY